MTTRLRLALADARDWPVAGRVIAYHPPAEIDLDVIDATYLRVVEPRQPGFAGLTRAGYDVVVEADGDADAAVVFLPRDRDEARRLIADALARTEGGPVLVDGPKSNGIEACLRELRGAVAVGPATSKAHGKAAIVRGDPPPQWRKDGAAGRNPAGYLTQAGLFSPDGPDPASVALGDALPARLPGLVADFGAGWGYLAGRILERDRVDRCHLIEADARALACARSNVADPRAVFHWADATEGDRGAFDAVVCNPPFHRGRAADPGLGRDFIAAAARSLRPRGTLWLVANRHLPYEEALARAFAEVVLLRHDGPFKLFRADRPKGVPRR